MSIDQVIEQEILKPPISVVRWSEQDETEPYDNFSELGFSLFKDFMGTLREKHPDRDYPSDEIIDRINPQLGNKEPTTTYMAYDGDRPVGAVIGASEVGRLQGHWILVDPEYRGGETIRKLLGAVGQDFHTITMLASSFSGEKNASQEEEAKQQQKLVSFYKRLGFVVDEKAESYKYSHIPGAPIPMVWNR